MKYLSLLLMMALQLPSSKIYVDSIAQKTDGYQMSRSLLLDDISKANNKPELEIYADDVNVMDLQYLNLIKIKFIT